MAYTQDEINDIYLAVLQRNADAGGLAVYSNSTTLTDAQVRNQIETSGEANQNVDPVVRLYQAAFDRLPDTEGLRANVGSYVAGGYNLTALANAFLSGPEAAAEFGQANPPVTTAFVATIYENALDREGSAGEYAYWVNSGKSAGQVLAEIAGSQEAVAKTDAPITAFLDAQAVAAVNDTQPSLGGDLYNQVPTNFTFTTDNDTIVGSAENDTFTSNQGFPPSQPGVVFAETVNTGDTVDGGAGLDTLNIQFDGEGGFGVPGTLKSVEIVTLKGFQPNVTVVGGAETVTGAVLDFSDAEGLRLLALDGSNSEVPGSTTSRYSLTLESGVIGGVNALTTGRVTFNYEGDDTFATIAVANGANVANRITVNSDTKLINTINVISTGSDGFDGTNTIGRLRSNSEVTTVNISGDVKLSILGDELPDSVTRLDASANTAGVGINFSSPEITIIGTAADDVFINREGTISAETAIDGGDGFDILRFGDGEGTSAVVSDDLTNIEQIEYSGTASLDFSDVDDLQLFVIRNVGLDGEQETTLKAGVIAAVNNVNAGSETFNFEGDLSYATVALANNSFVGNFTVEDDGISTVNIISNYLATDFTGIAPADRGNTIGTLDVDGATTVNILGNSGLTIDTLDTGVTKVDASQNTGGLFLTVGATDISVTGSQGSDLFVFGANLGTGDTVVGGSGTDTLRINSVDLTATGNADELSALNTKVSGVEVLEFVGENGATIRGGAAGTGAFTNADVTKILFNTGGDDTVDQAGSARTYAFGEDNNGAATLNGIAGNAKFAVSLEGIAGQGTTVDDGGGNGLTVNYTTTGGAAVSGATLNLSSTGADDDGSSLNANFVSSINLQANGNGLADATITVTGDKDLIIGSLANQGTVAASGFTGNLTAAGSVGGDTFQLGTGADIIDVSQGLSRFSQNTGGTDIGSGLTDTITNFSLGTTTTGTDTLVLRDNNGDVLEFTGGFQDLGEFQSGSLQQAAASAEGFLQFIGSQAGSFQYGGNTYVLANVDGDAGVTDAGSTDIFVKITGLVNLTANEAGIQVGAAPTP